MMPFLIFPEMVQVDLALVPKRNKFYEYEPVLSNKIRNKNYV